MCIYKVCIILRTDDVTYNDETLLIHVCIIYGTPLYLYMCIYINGLETYIHIYISVLYFVAHKDKTLYMYVESCILINEEYYIYIYIGDIYIYKSKTF